MDNDQEIDKRVRHDYTSGIILYLEITSIYSKLDHKKYGIYIITEVFTNCTDLLHKYTLNN